MSYALFAQKKLVLDGLINSVQLQQTQRSDEQMRLATNTLTLQSRVSNTQAAQSHQLSQLYTELSSQTDSDVRTSINNVIASEQEKFDEEINKINQEIYNTSIKENALEMEVKRLDTKLQALQKQLEKVEEAESKGIDRATPKFSGQG